MIKLLVVFAGVLLLIWCFRSPRPDEPPLPKNHYKAIDWPESPEERREAEYRRRVMELERELEQWREAEYRRGVRELGRDLEQ